MALEVRPSIVEKFVIVVKNNYGKDSTMIGKVGTVIGYNSNARQNIHVEFIDGTALWFDADELAETTKRPE